MECGQAAQIVSKAATFLVKGGFDGGFLEGETLRRHGWVTPFRINTINAEKGEMKKNWMLYVNRFLANLRGPRAEGKFAVEVNSLGILRRPFRLGLREYTTVLRLAEALLNVNRRKERNEDLPISEDDARASCFLAYHPSSADDLLWL